VADDDTFTVDEDSNDNPLDVLNGDTDVEGDLLTISAVGTPDSGGTAVNGGTVVTYTPLADFFGTEVFTYTVADGAAPLMGYDTATVTVTVSNLPDAPVADDDTFTVAENSSYNSLDVLDGDIDVDGDPLTIIDVGTPSRGGEAVNSGTLVVYTPQAGFIGDEVFIYTVSDGNGGYDTALVTVTVVSSANIPPVADDDTFAVDEDSFANPLDVLDGDTDANGDTLTITAVGTPDSGGAAVNGGTVITYTPLTGFVGDEVFTYTVSDGNGGHDTALVTVTVVSGINSPPVAVAGDDQSVAPGEIVTLDGSGSYDPDGDPLIYHWRQIGGEPQVLLNNATALSTTFTAPSSTAVLTFTLTVTDTPAGTLGLPSVPDIVVITVSEGDFDIYLPLVLKNY
jgi:hypothetical protein